MGKNKFLASLQMKENLGKWLVCGRAGLLFRKTSAAWKNSLMGTTEVRQKQMESPAPRM